MLLRHGTTTPGVGDPTGFRPDDCATQRNLTEAGREESRRLGAAGRADAGLPGPRRREARGQRLILVTHGATVATFVGVSPAPAVMVIVTPQGNRTFTVAGRLPAP